MANQPRTDTRTARTAEAQSLDVWRRMHRPVLALTAVLAVLVSVLGWFAIPILLGDEFAAARSVLPILCVAAIPYASYHFDSAACVGLRDLRTGGVGALQGCLTLLVTTTIGYALLDTPGIAYGVLLTYLGMAVTTRMRMPGGRLHRPGGAPVPTESAHTGPVAAAGEARVVPVREWDELIGSLGGLGTYTRSAYHRASALLEPRGTEQVLLHVRQRRGEIALPLLLRPLPGGGGWDATSAYGYGGPIGAGAPDAAAFGEAVDTWARGNDVVTTFLRLDPLRDNARLVPPTADLVPLAGTVAWNVSAGRDLMAGMHAHHRRAARTADRAGLALRVVPQPRSLRRFRELYAATMQRRHADPFFSFPAGYWDSLLADAPVIEPVLVEGALGGRVVASLLCFADGSRLHYHLGASDAAARSIGASHRCFLEAARWAQAQGMSVFHLGGGLGGGRSSLFDFKLRFDQGTQPLPFSVAKLIHDPVRYRELTGGDSTEGFFPPWRRAR